MELRFAGHETFHCKHIWLKKGYDFLVMEKKFSDPDAIVELGVGKNMVQSIRYWLEVFGITEDHLLSNDYAEKIFSNTGLDPYLNDIGTLWILHYYLVTNSKATIYNLFFNRFRKQRIEFTSDLVKGFIKGEINADLNEKMIDRDINVFIRNYLPPAGKSTNVEDDYSVLLQDLNLIQRIDKERSGRGSWYIIENKERENLPSEIVLFAILQKYTDKYSISFYELLNGDNSPGSVFSLNADGLYKKLEEIVASNDDIVFKEDADVKTLQFKKNIDPWAVLTNYYE